MGRPSFGRTLAVRGLDMFDTPPAALGPLFAHEPLLRGVTSVCEPFCGRRNLVTAMRERGLVVHASDIFSRGCPDSTTLDFFDMAERPCSTLISNPPYAQVTALLEHAWRLRFRTVAFLCVSSFLQTADRYERVHKRGHLVRVHTLAERLQNMHDANYAGPKASQAQLHSWFVFDRNHCGPATINPVSLRQPDARLPWTDNGIDNGTDNGRVNNTYHGPRGTSRRYVMSRLARDGRADLTARVESGELSVRAALRLIQRTQSPLRLL
jgi:hypothetical protein